MNTLDDSKVMQFLFNFWREQRKALISSIETSIIVSRMQELREALYASAVKTASRFVLVAIAGEIVLSIILFRRVGLWYWLTRSLFLFTAISGSLCDCDWPSLKKGSLLLRKSGIS